MHYCPVHVFTGKVTWTKAKISFLEKSVELALNKQIMNKVMTDWRTVEVRKCMIFKVVSLVLSDSSGAEEKPLEKWFTYILTNSSTQYS